LNKTIIRYFLIILAIGIISLLFPRHQKIDIECVVGQVWDQADYHAPFDFDIYKSKENESEKRKEIAQQFPVVLSNSNINFKQLVKAIVSSNPNSSEQADVIESKIVALYKQPIIDAKFAKNQKEIILSNKEDNRRIKPAEAQTPNQIQSELFKQLKATGVLLDSNALNDWVHTIVPNYIIDNDQRNKLIDDELAANPREKSSIKKGQTILRNGEIVTEKNKSTITQLKTAAINAASTDKYGFLINYLGYFILTVLIIGALIMFVRRFYPPIYGNLRELSFILFWPVLFSLLVFAVEQNVALSTYLIPFCIVPIIVKNFYSSRMALFVHIVVVLIASFLSQQGYEFTFLQILAGIITVLFVSETRFWNKFFLSIFFIFIAYLLGFLGLSLINSSGLEYSELPIFGWLLMNSFLLLLAYPLIPLVEKAFGFISDITLAELCDMNNPLLKRLSIEAPGTLQHSLQVANLSEAAADKIGANALLVKTAALYHDVGKMEKPHYFIENTKGANPHDELNDNFESAKIIINHVIDGEAMAKKAKLPKVLINFIKTHHGDSRVEYFYRNQLTKSPDHEFDETLFRVKTSIN